MAMRALGQRLRDQEIVCSPSVAPRLRMSPLWIWHGSFPVTSRQSLSGQSSVVVKTLPKTLVGGAPMQDTTGNECCAEVPTHPSHNKSLNADSFVRKARIMLQSKEIYRKVRLYPVLSVSAFNLPPSGREVLVFQYLGAFFRTAIFVALIPKDIPGSFCEF